MATTKKPAAKKPAAKKTAAKKTTSKPAAKKTTTAKSTTKKAATTKTTAKKTTATKTTTKVAAKTTTKKVVTKKAVEISVTGNKKIDTLRKEFNKQFPYLRLGLYYSYMRNESTKTPLSGDKTLASVRRADSGGDISIAGNKKIKTLEKEFDTVFGLYAQVCYTDADGSRYYTGSSSDEKTLASFNEECEKNGCKKGVWK
jgi:cytoskeletal protein RodZ